MPPEEQSIRSTSPRAASLRAQRDGVLDRQAACDVVGAGQADEQRQLGRPLGAHGVDRFHQEACAAVEVAAIGIVAVVGDRREERMQQVAVRGVQLGDLEAGLARHPGGRRRTARRSRRCRPGSASSDRWRRRRTGSGLAPAGPSRPRPGGTGSPPSQGRRTLALRPAWASWMPGTAPQRAMMPARRASSA